MNTKKMPRLIFIVVSIVGLAAAATICTFYLSSRPQLVRIRLDLDQEATTALSQAIADYDSITKTIATRILPSGSEQKPDLLVAGNITEGSPWRTRGWRLWSRLESVAATEAAVGKQLILRLRLGDLSNSDFLGLLSTAKKRGVFGFSVPGAPPEYRAAFDLWFGIFFGDRSRAPDLPSVNAATIPTTQGAIDMLSRGQVLFIIGPDEIGGLIQKGSDNHPEAFPLPGSKYSGSSWAIGYMDRITIAPGTSGGAAREAADLITYLTSPGIARALSEKIPGELHRWKTRPERGKLPKVDAPETFYALDGK